MSKKGIVYLLMILNVHTYVDGILEHLLRANESHIEESPLTILKQILTQLNGCFL